LFAAQVLDPDMLRRMLKMTFQPPGVERAIKMVMKKFPEDLQHPFEDLISFARELDEKDLDAIVGDFVALVKQFRVKMPRRIEALKKQASQRTRSLKKQASAQITGGSFGTADESAEPNDIPQFNFPGDLLACIDPIDILQEMSSKIPAPFDMVREP